MTGTCLLCEKAAAILASHVLPAFAFRAMKKGSGTGHIRYTEKPNQRLQGGITEPWLCAECESRFSRWEREFANNVFYPWSAGGTYTRYAGWMLKFCVSVSWRVLSFCKGRNPDAVYTSEQEQRLEEARCVWREFLLDLRPNPGRYTQQFVIFDIITSTTVDDLPDNINRFMMNAIAMDIVGSSRAMFTWAKLGRFQIFGVIEEGLDRFEGTKVHVRDGVLRPDRVILPAGLLGLFKEKASHGRTAMAGISNAQTDKIDAAVLAKIDRFAESNQFAAMQADAALFGQQAVIRPPRRNLGLPNTWKRYRRPPER